MNEHGDAVQRRTVDDGHAHETALGEHDVRAQSAQEALGLKSAGDDAERIGEVFHVEVAAQFAALYRVIGDARKGFYERALDAFLCADVVNIPAFLLQEGDEREVGASRGRPCRPPVSTMRFKEEALLVG